MPVIQFDCLVPDSHAATLGQSFAAAVERLIAADKMSGGSARHTPSPTVPEGVEEQLRSTYETEHGREPEGMGLHRYDIEVEGLSGSVNQLTMVLARFLTPRAELPKDPVLLMREQDYELPATYPWTVSILR